jgi:hypothetical protein
MKNIFLLGLLTFVTLSYAKEPIEKESIKAETMDEAASFKVEKAVKEKSAGRAFAGARAKKESGEVVEKSEGAKTEDSEVQYWQYQE